MESVNLDLKKLVKSDMKDLNSTDHDQTYLELKHRSVVESLDARCETLKKKYNLVKSENDLLRSELSVLQAAGTPLEDKFANGKKRTGFCEN